MAAGGWAAKLNKKEYLNWVMCGYALDIAKNGIASKIQTEMEACYHSLASRPSLHSLSPCTCDAKTWCVICRAWKRELTRLSSSMMRWINSDKNKWGTPEGVWEIAKVFMSPLGGREKDVVNAETTDISGLLILLEYCLFVNSPTIKTVAQDARDKCRNHWAHAPKQELQNVDVDTIFDYLERLLNDPVFNTEKPAQDALKYLQCLKKDGLVVWSEVKVLDMLRQSLVVDVADAHDQIAQVQAMCHLNSEELGNVSTEVSEVKIYVSEVEEKYELNRETIDKQGQRLEKLTEVVANLSEILHAVDDFNERVSPMEDVKVIHDDVKEVRCGMQNVVMEVNAIKSKLVNLETRVTSLELHGETMEGKTSQEESSNNDDVLPVYTAPSSLPWFTGRKSALEWLERNLVLESVENDPGSSCCTKAICGLGGCGKTSLTVQFSWKYKDRFPGGVFWINGESNENIQKSVAEILSLVKKFVSTTTENIDDILNVFLPWLPEREKPWLLVLDNVDELEDSPTGIKKIYNGPWQKNTSVSKYGHILLTTRQNAKNTSSFLNLSSGDCFELECFSVEEGAQFLMQRTGIQGDSFDPYARQLTEELGSLPLALEQAGAYMSASPITMSFKDYLNKCKDAKVSLLKRRPALPRTHVEAMNRLSVHTTWEMNFDAVKKESPAAATMIRIAAFLESDNIPIDVINPGFPELDQEELKEQARSEIDIAEILRVLTCYSLFSVRQETKVFGVHKLVQELVRENLTPLERIEAMVAGGRLLHFAFRNVQDYESCSYLEVNFASLRDHMANEINSSDEQETVKQTLSYDEYFYLHLDVAGTALEYRMGDLKEKIKMYSDVPWTY